MKRGNILRGSAILILFLLSVVVVAAQKDVGYILLSQRNKNPVVVSVFDELNLTYDLIEDKKLSSFDLGSYRFLFIDDVRLNNAKKKPIYNYPSIIMNKYYGYDWGLTDRDGLSQMTSTSPLSVIIPEDGRAPVYTQAKTSLNGQFIPFYYIEDENKDGVSYTSLARAFEGGGEDDANGAVREFGDVVAGLAKGSQLANGKTSGGKICFYGVAKTKYWTAEARQLLKDCIGYVGAVCYNDNDCPQGQFFNGKFCVGDEIWQNFSVYSCVNPGTIQSECIETSEVRRNETCEFACYSGECIRCDEDLDCDDDNTGTEDKCISPGLANSSCQHNNITCFEDLDCGIDGFIGLSFCSSETTLSQVFQTWTCNNAGTSSSSCSNSSEVLELETCSDICIDGACRVIECYNNSDCDDSNTWTEDVCLNPGTYNSRCQHNNITCFTKSDCGDDFLSGLTCSGNKVVRSFINFTCNNAGSSSSSCSNLSGTINIQTCLQNCVSGQCININCTQDSDCNDLDDRTFDECVNPNTTASFCRNTEVNCLSNADCGFTGFSGGEYCFGNSVFKNFHNSSCVDSGTLNSYCLSRVSSQFLQDCGVQTCSEYSSNYCKGDDVYKSRTCNNPFCQEGACLADLELEEELVDECDFGCTNGACEPECTQTDLSRCEPGSNMIYCSGDVLVNTTITPICTILGTCSISIVNDTETCEFGCSDGMCLPDTRVHDVALIDFADAVNGISITNKSGGNPVLAGGSVNRFRIYRLNVNVLNKGNFSENVSFSSDDCFSTPAILNAVNLAPGSSQLRWTATPYVNVTCSLGWHNVTVTANSPGDENPSDNVRTREFKVVDFRCSQNSDCGTGSISPAFCIGDLKAETVTNHTCDMLEFSSGCSSSSVNNTLEVCEYGCYLGECNPECTQTDLSRCGGVSDSAKFCTGKNVTFNRTSPVCLSGECATETNLVLDEVCADYCENGECKEFNCEQDSDCGSPFYSSGLFCTGKNVTQNYTVPACMSPGTILSNCVNVTSSQLNKTCEDYCENGECKSFTCHNDTECDDGNYRTYDTCLNASTIGSSCSHTNITCFNNSECGIDGFIGEGYCSGSLFLRDFESHTCNNAGTVLSFCNSSITQEVQECRNISILLQDDFSTNTLSDYNTYSPPVTYSPGKVILNAPNEGHRRISRVFSGKSEKLSASFGINFIRTAPGDDGWGTVLNIFLRDEGCTAIGKVDTGIRKGCAEIGVRIEKASSQGYMSKLTITKYNANKKALINVKKDIHLDLNVVHNITIVVDNSVLSVYDGETLLLSAADLSSTKIEFNDFAIYSTQIYADLDYIDISGESECCK